MRYEFGGQVVDVRLARDPLEERLREFYLGACAHVGGPAFVRRAELAGLMGVSERTLGRALGRMVEEGGLEEGPEEGSYWCGEALLMAADAEPAVADEPVQRMPPEMPVVPDVPEMPEMPVAGEDGGAATACPLHGSARMGRSKFNGQPLCGAQVPRDAQHRKGFCNWQPGRMPAGRPALTSGDVNPVGETETRERTPAAGYPPELEGMPYAISFWQRHGRAPF